DPRVRHGVRLPGARDRLRAADLAGVLAPGSEHLDARRERGLPADRGAAAAPPPPGRGLRSTRDAPRLGALVRRAPREPRLVSGALVLPLAARQPVVGRCADDDPRRLRPR